MSVRLHDSDDRNSQLEGRCKALEMTRAAHATDAAALRMRLAAAESDARLQKASAQAAAAELGAAKLGAKQREQSALGEGGGSSGGAGWGGSGWGGRSGGGFGTPARGRSWQAGSGSACASPLASPRTDAVLTTDQLVADFLREFGVKPAEEVVCAATAAATATPAPSAAKMPQPPARDSDAEGGCVDGGI